MFTRLKWIFDLPRLQKGDVLFTRSKFAGDGIAKTTKGRFGHAMLYLDGMVIHADTKGVWSKNPQRILMSDQSRLAAFRPKTALSANHLQRIEDYARARVGSLYSIPEAVRSLQAPSTTRGRYLLDRQYCSRLVAQSFAEVGINLVDDFDYCTPNEIADSTLLREVPDAVRQANADEIAFARTPDFNLELQVETYRWLNKVRSLAERRQLPPIYSQSEVGQWLLDRPEFDAEVCNYIQETKYLTYFDADARKNPWRYHPQLMLAALLSASSPEDALEFERRQCEKNRGRVYNERLKAISNARSGLVYFKLEEQLQSNRLIEMIKWAQAVEYAGKVIGRYDTRE